MDGVLPMAMSLNRIEARLDGIGTRLRILGIDIGGLFAGLDGRRFKVQVMNQDLLDNAEATRWAMADVAFKSFPQLLAEVAGLHWLAERSHLHLHDIIGLLDLIWFEAGLLTDVAGLITGLVAQVGEKVDALIRTVALVGYGTNSLLWAILQKLNQGIGVHGTIKIEIAGGGGGEDGPGLWAKLGMLAVAAALIAGFVALLGLAFRTFRAGAITAAIAIGVLVTGLIPLLNTLAAFKLTQLGKIGLGFAAIAGFVALLGKAFQQFTTDIGKVVPHLTTFFGSIAKLMTTLAAFKGRDLAKIGLGFAGIAGFVALLGKAFQQFTTDIGKVVPHLTTFFDGIAKLMTTLAKFKPGEMVIIAAGFLVIAGFVWLLGRALATITDQAIAAMDPLTRFVGVFPELMNAIARFTPGEMATIAAGFLMIAGFVWLLSMALNTLTEQSIGAMEPLAGLLGAMSALATKLGSMTAGEMITMAIGLLLIAGFVWAVAAALKFAAGPLEILGKMFESFGAILSRIGDIAGRVWGVLSDIGGFFKDVGGGISDFVTGDLFSSIDVQAIVDRRTAMAAAQVPPPPPPAAGAPAAAGALGPLSPGGALAAAAAGGPATVDQSVNAGGINVSITADRLEANSAQLLTDEIVAQLQERLAALRSTQDFRAGGRPMTA
ncbi:hypothetical protein [Winogradskya humida]|uniref:Phage-related protein n=1 Tax=Winogradskya humida TaxID=113566 RepID=A0ABQ3ZYF9_9ACTN|nr:hypothetical protein [Actinoplanes humidus]GIE23630.1 hypothetical protein Ahu01nite_067320 [Actinoplanes humidus]